MNQTGSVSVERRNFWAFLVDIVSFIVAISFVDTNAVMPALARQLTDSGPVIGLVGTIFTAGWLVPQLAAARFLDDKPRKRPYMLAGLSGRLSLLIVALALWAGLSSRPASMLLVYYGGIGLFSITDGFTSVTWFDLLGRTIPLRRRGRLIGAAQFVGGVLALGVGALVGLILDRLAFPKNYALLFGLACVSFVPSVVALFLIREPPAETPVEGTRVGSFRTWMAILGEDCDFRRLMACRFSVGMMSLATSFYVVHAADVLHLPERVIGSFVVAQTASRIASSLVMGWISERLGPHSVIRLGSGLMVSGPLLALLIHLSGGQLGSFYPLAYVSLGAFSSMMMLGFFSYLLEIAPDSLRPTYLGLSNTLMGVVTLAPTLGGWLLEVTSYPVLFGLTAAISCGGFLLSLGLTKLPVADPAVGTELCS